MNILYCGLRQVNGSRICGLPLSLCLEVFAGHHVEHVRKNECSLRSYVDQRAKLTCEEVRPYAIPSQHNTQPLCECQ